MGALTWTAFVFGFIGLCLAITSIVISLVYTPVSKQGVEGATGPTGDFSGYNGIWPIANGGTNSSAALNNNCIMVSDNGSIREGTSNKDPVFDSLSLLNTGFQISFGNPFQKLSLNVIDPGANVTTTLRTCGLDSEFVLTECKQTINGKKTFSDHTTFETYLIVDGTGDFKNLQAETGDFKQLYAQTGDFRDLYAQTGTFDEIYGVTGTFDYLTAQTGFFQDLTITGSLHATGFIQLKQIGSSPNPNGMTLTLATSTGPNYLNLEPASAFFGGVVSTGMQEFAGDKRFLASILMTGGNIYSRDAYNSSGGAYLGGQQLHLHFQGGDSSNYWAIFDQTGTAQFQVHNTTLGGPTGAVVNTFNTTLDNGLGDLIMKNDRRLEWKDSSQNPFPVLSVASDNTTRFKGATGGIAFLLPDNSSSSTNINYNNTGPVNVYNGAILVSSTDSSGNLLIGSNSTTNGIKFRTNFPSYNPSILNFFEETGYTIQMTYNGGPTSTNNHTINVSRLGNSINFTLEGISEASLGAGYYYSVSNLDARFKPNREIKQVIAGINNSVDATALCIIDINGQIFVYLYPPQSNFSATNNVGFYNFSVTYNITS